MRVRGKEGEEAYRSSKTSNCIPANLGWEAGRVAAESGAVGDIGESSRCDGVEPWIEEAEDGLAGCEEGVVD
jgi:hypothetical protein